MSSWGVFKQCLHRRGCAMSFVLGKGSSASNNCAKISATFKVEFLHDRVCHFFLLCPIHVYRTARCLSFFFYGWSRAFLLRVLETLTQAGFSMLFFFSFLAVAKTSLLLVMEAIRQRARALLFLHASPLSLVLSKCTYYILRAQPSWVSVPLLV